MPVFQPVPDMYVMIALIIFSAGFLIVMLHYWLIFSGIAFYKQPQKSGSPEAVSVVICAKNEGYHLQKNLPLIFTQLHQDIEVVVVNDASDDDTDEILENFKKDYPILKIVNIKQNLNFFSGKKFPLAVGIKSAQNDIVVHTNANCRPAGIYWLKSIQDSYADGTEIVLAYAPYFTTTGFFNKLVRFDNFHDSVHHLSMAVAGFPYKGSGRNLSYRKSLFYKNKGFISHYAINAGDDDLFINHTAKGNNTSVNLDAEAMVYSPGPKDFASWYRIKKTAVFTASHYKAVHKFFRAVYTWGQFFFYIGIIALLYFWYNPAYLLIPILIKFISQIFIFKKGMQKLNEKDLLLISPLLEVILLIVNCSLKFSLFFSNKSAWK